MNVYEKSRLDEILKSNSYPGRGIVIGMTPDCVFAVTAYFIMGRSENSRNRVFVQEGESVTIYPFDESKVGDPSLIIYSPVRVFGNNLIVTNGNQTDTVFDGLKCGKSFSQSLAQREFEPDFPNLTPRISGIMTFENKSFTYSMSILKSADEKGSGCNRFTFDYSPVAGVGHFIHTYNCDGSPLPTFTGEPERVCIGNNPDSFASELWNSLDQTNKVSLLVRYVNLNTNETKTIIKNKHTEER